MLPADQYDFRRFFNTYFCENVRNLRDNLFNHTNHQGDVVDRLWAELTPGKNVARRSIGSSQIFDT